MAPIPAFPQRLMAQPSSQAGAAEPALPGRNRSLKRWRKVAPIPAFPQRLMAQHGFPLPSSQAGAAEPALPGRRRSAPSGGSAVHEVTSVGAYALW
jgi:hypothetical protein